MALAWLSCALLSADLRKCASLGDFRLLLFLLRAFRFLLLVAFQRIEGSLLVAQQ
jgi:hypothetical protein